MRRAIAGAVCAGALVWWGLAVTAPSHHAEIGTAATSTPTSQRPTPGQWMLCAEDDRIVVDLYVDGLPEAYCEHGAADDPALP